MYARVCLCVFPVLCLRRPHHGVRLPVCVDLDGRWRAVGRALKAIDRSLFGNWVEWTDDYVPASQCQLEWDSFGPISCDTHAPASAVRDAFLALLHKRDVNFSAAFDKVHASRHPSLCWSARPCVRGPVSQACGESEGLTPTQFHSLLESTGLTMSTGGLPLTVCVCVRTLKIGGSRV